MGKYRAPSGSGTSTFGAKNDMHKFSGINMMQLSKDGIHAQVDVNKCIQMHLDKGLKVLLNEFG